MQPEKKHVRLNGLLTDKHNYLWGGALSLAWQELKNNIIKEDIKVNSDDGDIHQLVQNFNSCPFNKSHLSPDSYYVRSGFGQETVNLINFEVSNKFPEKTTNPLNYKLTDSDIISFAYFFKKLSFPIAFEKSQVMFNEKKVKGFRAKEKSEKKQVLVSKYKNPDNFIVSLTNKSKNDEVFLLKSEQKYQVEEVIEIIDKIKFKGEPLGKNDVFAMPNVSIKSERKVKQLIGKFLSNQQWRQYMFFDIYEIIKIDIDNTGVKAENEGAIVMTRGATINSEKPKHILLDKSFWLVMKEVGKHPYLAAFISEPIQSF